MSNQQLLLDTHVWFRLQASTRDLRPEADVAIEEASRRNAVFVSVISVWELAMLERARYLEMNDGVQRWSDEALAKPGISLLPFSQEIAVEAVYLPQPMHKDPADRILVASARIAGFTLVTSDKAIIAFAKATHLPYLRA